MKRDAQRDGFVNVIRKAMGQKLGDDTDKVLKVLNERGITKKLAKEALEIARQRGRLHHLRSGRCPYPDLGQARQRRRPLGGRR
ncbi:MAG: hypothetical protein V1790_00940 [Planctomycetota bacterium]